MDIGTLIIVTTLSTIVYLAGEKLYRLYKFSKVLNQLPGPKTVIPFFGIPWEILRLPKEERLEWSLKLAHGFESGIHRVWIGPMGIVGIRKPEQLEVILRSTEQITKSFVYYYLQPWLGQGLLTSTGAQWFHSRKLITPAFHFGILDNFTDVMIDKANILNKCIDREIQIHGDKPFDIFGVATVCTLDIICETAMGVKSHAQEQMGNDYSTAVSTKTGGSIIIGLMFDGGGKKKAFLDLLLEANEKEDNPLTIEEIRDQANTFMFAGHDTTGALIAWTLFCLGNELDVQTRVHQELDEVLGDADDQATLKLLSNLKYLDRVIKEVLRLYPSAPAIGRQLTDDLQIDGYVIPKGAVVTIEIYMLHRDPAIWPDPLRFDPDRFLPENSKVRHPYAYLPFSAGPRNCIGRRYAILETKIILAQVLRNFKVKSVETHETVKKYGEIILRPIDGIYVHMERR